MKTIKFKGISIGVTGLTTQFKGKILKPDDGLATVTVTGEERDVDALTNEDLRITADASTITETGEHVLGVSVDVPPGIQYEVSFKNVTVLVEQA